MPASDVLKNFRSSGYGGDKSSPDKPGMDDGQENSTSRIIKLTDDEQKSFAQANPGDDLACEVHGSLEKDGHFHVMSVGPMGGGQPDEAQMAGEVMQKVNPGMGVAQG